MHTARKSLPVVAMAAVVAMLVAAPMSATADAGVLQELELNRSSTSLSGSSRVVAMPVEIKLHTRKHNGRLRTEKRFRHTTGPHRANNRFEIHDDNGHKIKYTGHGTWPEWSWSL